MKKIGFVIILTVLSHLKLPNLKVGPNYKNKLVYLIGKSENELLTYDEYDSEGDGKWFYDNPVMAAIYK